MAAPRTVLVLALLTVAATARYTRWHELERKDYDFDQYKQEYLKRYANAEEEQARMEIFNRRLRQVLAHNRDTTQTWKAGVNHLTDRTDEELSRMRGYNRALARSARPAHPARKLFTETADVRSLPESVDWRRKGAVTPVKDQGSCGSCWTFASASTIESAWFLAGNQMVELSEQQIASCTTNPDSCGGTGGCEGGIAELAFQSVFDNGGLSSEWTYPYRSHDGTDFTCVFNANVTKPVAKISGYFQLPTNNYESLMAAVARYGPIAISVDASIWNSYESGIFDGCNMKDPVIDHNVQLAGYGEENGVGYWLVRNSWTPLFGEDGYIRVRRYLHEAQPCGVDTDPGAGSGCTPGPANVTVCGMCGLLSDSSFPIV